jgi:hypothetical protein
MIKNDQALLSEAAVIFDDRAWIVKPRFGISLSVDN